MMIFTFEKQEVTLDELRTGKITENILSVSERAVVKFIKDWFDGKKYFEIPTSGSTGTPQQMLLSREKLIYSANTSLDYLDPNQSFNNSLLCINPTYIGGMMVVVRALIRKMNLIVIPPSRDISLIYF